VDDLERKGIKVTGIPQGWKLSPHIDYTERLLYAGRITHNGGPMLRWNMGNARAEDRHGARSITKPSGASVGPQKVDGCLCLIMACALATEHKPSVYEDHGLRVIYF
jgi:phage terminase large subunit-like protein